MEKLTEKRLNEIFKECNWPYEEWCNLQLIDEEAPIVVRLLLPFVNDEDFITFHPDKLKENKEIIAQFLDQIAWLIEKTSIYFGGLGKLKDDSEWTNNMYEIQKLYLLGAATNQLVAISIDSILCISRVFSDKSIEDKYNELMVLEKSIGGNMFLN